MPNERESTTSPAEPLQRAPFVPHGIVAIFTGVVFVLAVLLTAILPAIALVYLIVGLAIDDVIVILVLWAVSTVVSLSVFIAIRETFIKTVLKRRVISKLPVADADDES